MRFRYNYVLTIMRKIFNKENFDFTHVTKDFFLATRPVMVITIQGGTDKNSNFCNFYEYNDTIYWFYSPIDFFDHDNFTKEQIDEHVWKIIRKF